MALPTKTKQWVVAGRDGFESLKFVESADVPQLGDHDVLVQIRYVSLNYRDLIIPKGKYPFPTASDIVPCSDGAGTVLATGSRVSTFHKGDKVVAIFNQSHLAGPITKQDLQSGLGGGLGGTLRQYGVFEESGLVKMPESLTFKEAATLPCAAVTAWNALYGLESKGLRTGDWVLTQGTGGVSMFALQFAKAAGARVVATTSSDDKTQALKAAGADHILNYRSTPSWGAAAKSLTTAGLGFNHIVEVAGPKSMAQSLAAIKPEGVISIIGFLGGAGGKSDQQQPGFLECLSNVCTVRGIMVGSRAQFESMNAAVDAVGIKPVVEKRVFGFEQAREAYQYMWDQKHFGKVVIKVSEEEGEVGAKL